MQYRTFGKTGLRVSRLGFGVMRVPTLEDGTADMDVSVPLLRRGIDLGIDLLDSAWGYLKGTSEMAIGAAIKGLAREDLVLSTKIPVHDEESGRPEVWRSRLEECLRRLDTSYIDLIFFHDLSWFEFQNYAGRPGLALDAARQAQAEGLVRHICFSCHDTTDNVQRLIDTGEFAGLLLQYNFLDRHNEPAIEHVARRGLGVAIMGPVAGGRLDRPGGVALNGQGSRQLRTPELALRFVWSNPFVDAALSGMSNVSQLEENVAAADRAGEMNEAEQEQIVRVVEANQKLAELYCTGCGYCMPCPNDVHIPENFRYMNWHRVWGLEQQARQAYAKLSADGVWTAWAGMVKGLNAAACIECGECEPKCPQNIPIIEQLAEVAKTLGE
jgi:predicted aldo/keto reductase-like oxidoreductase